MITWGIKMDLNDYTSYSVVLCDIGTKSLRSVVLRDIGTKSFCILDTQYFVLERILKRVELPNILWISWVECPYSSLPSWIPSMHSLSNYVMGLPKWIISLGINQHISI